MAATLKLAVAMVPGLPLGTASAQIVPVLKSSDTKVDKTFKLSVEILYRNTQDNLIKAGGEYGGEWTRDCSINAWNAASLLDPASAKNSLWSVTTDNRTYIGHQYWDQIIWVTGAWDHYEKTGDRTFLNQAYTASKNSMTKLEKEQFDSQYGLFKGPSVFNDGIAGYEEPIYDPALDGHSYVLDHHASDIKCLSTNAIYYNAYLLLAKMANFKGDADAEKSWLKKAATLKANIRQHLFNGTDKLYYLIDQNGKIHDFQEALGIAYAVLFGVVSHEEAGRIIDASYKGRWGTPSIYPHFKRYNDSRPGRHNKIVWPFVSAFFGSAANEAGCNDRLGFELKSLSSLCQGSQSKHNGVQTFYEIYNETTGVPDGGWQCSSHWGSSVYDQTWSATGFIRLILTDVLGMRFTPEGLTFEPNIKIATDFGVQEVKEVTYRGGLLDISVTGTGDRLVAVRVDGVEQLPVTPIAPQAGKRQVELVFGSDLDLTAKYERADLALKPGSWDSSKNIGEGTGAADGTAASRVFSRDELPTGSLIFVDEGYEYRPEGWETDATTTDPRPETTHHSATVTDGWWSYFGYRGFNVAKVDGSGLTADEAGTHFSVFLPKVLGDGGDFTIVNKNSGRPLAIRDDDNAIVQNSEAASKAWTVAYAGGGYYRIIDKQSGQALQMPGGSNKLNTRPTLTEPGDDRNQLWNIIELSEGLYRIAPKCAPTMALGVSGSSKNNGAIVVQRTYDTGDAQRWLFSALDPTGIIQTDAERHDDGAVYDVSGRKVASVKTKGIYIHNNRKVVDKR